MVLIEKKTRIPLDLVIFINSFFLYEKLTDDNFKEAIALWFENKKKEFRQHRCLWEEMQMEIWSHQ
jgi:hypothetical protein